MSLTNAWRAWVLAMVIGGATLLVGCGPAPSHAPEWVHETVCPMVGPMQKTSGPKGKTLEQILKDFRPEIAEWSVLPTLTGSPRCPKKILGGLEYQEFPQGPARDYKLWEDQFGSKWEANEDCGVAVPSSGKVSDWKYGSEQKHTLWFVCHNSPKWHAFHKESILRCARDASCALIRQDNIAGPSGVLWDNGGWCKWCLGGFKERLGKRFTAEQLRQLGVDNLGAFDPGAFLHARLAEKKPEELIEDPLVREYNRFMQKSNLELWRDEIQGAHAIRADVPVCGNQGSGGLTAYPSVLLSDASDLIFLENSRRQYPNNPNTVNYAVALAGGRHSKPAWIWDFGYPEYMEQVDHSVLFVAECYATGATPYYEMNNLAHSPKKGYYIIAMGERTYDALKGCARFAHAHKELLTRGYRADARVAILYSVPSFVPKCCGGMRIGGKPLQEQTNHLVGFARFLEQSHVPYNVEVLGDEELWPDKDLDARLARYHVLICPNVEAISDAQAASLRKAVAGGRRLVISGDLATRDEGFAKRPKPALDDLQEEVKGKVTRMKDEPVAFLTAHMVQDSRGASQQVTVNQKEAKPLVVRGWSRCRDVAGASDSDYSLWVDLTYDDGTPLWAQAAKFKTGTHDWQQAELVISPSKPVKSATVHALFRYHSGAVWFDDLFFGEEGGPNLLKNPDLEGGDGKQIPDWVPTVGWQKQEAGYTPDTQAKSGKGCIRCEIAKPTGESPAAAAMSRAFQEVLGAERQIETDAPATVFIRPVRLGDRMVIHLLNCDYDGGEERIKPVGRIKLNMRLPDDASGLKGDAMLATPDAPESDVVLPSRVSNGRVAMELPQLRIWSIVHFSIQRK